MDSKAGLNELAFRRRQLTRGIRDILRSLYESAPFWGQEPGLWARADVESAINLLHAAENEYFDTLEEQLGEKRS